MSLKSDLAADRKEAVCIRNEVDCNVYVLCLQHNEDEHDVLLSCVQTDECCASRYGVCKMASEKWFD
jgi:hypothetical protein